MKANITKIIELNIKAQHSGVYIAPVILAGSPGIGKSTAFKEIVKNNNYSIINFSLAAISIEQFSGLPSDFNTPDMEKYDTLSMGNTKATQWSCPEIIYQANKAAQTSKVLLLLDDMHEASPSVKTYLYELLLERKLGQYQLDQNVAIVGTTNDSDEANFNGFSSAVRNRLAILKTDVEYGQFMKDVGGKFHYYISSLLHEQPALLQEDESTGIEGFATPRSWDFLSNTLKSMDNEFIVENTAVLAAQYVSESCADALASHVSFINSINFKKVLLDKKIITISDLDIKKQLVFYYIINEVSTIADGAYIINMINHNLPNSSFMGFLFGEIAVRYAEANKKEELLSDGMQFILDKLLTEPLDASNYKNKLTTKEKEIFTETEIEESKTVIKIVQQYIL